MIPSGLSHPVLRSVVKDRCTFHYKASSPRFEMVFSTPLFPALLFFLQPVLHSRHDVDYVDTVYTVDNHHYGHYGDIL